MSHYKIHDQFKKQKEKEERYMITCHNYKRYRSFLKRRDDVQFKKNKSKRVLG